MRKILFRGLYNGQWVYGTYHYSNDGKHHYILGREKLLSHDGGYMSLHDKEVWEVDPKSIGQFTGLLDDKNKEIYDGDILNFPMPDGDTIMHVIYNDCTACFDVEYPETHECETLYTSDFEDHKPIVIGNIHQTAS